MAKKLIFISVSIAVLIILLIQFLPMINLRAKNMISKEFDHFTFYYEKKDSAAISDLEKSLGTSYLEITDKLGFKIKRKANIYVYPDLNTFHQKKYGMLGKLFGPEWYVGDNINDKILIVSPLNPGRQHSYETILGVVVHEYVHSVIAQINKKVPKWMNEGLAGYLSGNTKPWNGWSMNDYDIPSSKEMKTENPIKFGNRGYYQLSFVYIKFLDEKYGMKKLSLLIRKPNAYSVIYGLTEDEIYDEWVNYLENHYK